MCVLVNPNKCSVIHVDPYECECNGLVQVIFNTESVSAYRQQLAQAQNILK